MEEKISLDEMSRWWEVLHSRKRQSDELVRPAPLRSDGSDPFDCSDCAVPVAYALIEDAVSQAVNEWRDLDDRKIPEEEAKAAASTLQEGQEEPRPVKKKPRWFNRHVRLPPSFDVATKDDEPPEDDGGGDRVIQLDDPTQTASYHQELWRIFKSVPTRSMLEAEAIEGLSSPAMMSMRDEFQKMESTTQKTRDDFGVTRLRMCDRHGAPETSFAPPSRKTKGTIVFEIWKGMIPHLSKSSSPSEERMVLEFRSDQTLLDFHRAIVELSMDEFWETRVNTEQKCDSKVRSGLFAIEEYLYTHGELDYSVPIMEWLKDDAQRAEHNLGVALDRVAAQSMDSIRLEEIPMRLGVRYLHVHSGTFKSQVFLIDRRYGYPRQPTLARNYPIIHDLWCVLWAAPDCEVCRRRTSVIVTSLECDLTDGHRIALPILCRPTAYSLATLPRLQYVEGIFWGTRIGVWMMQC